ncbi:MAG: hypothetical protein K2X39_07590, partial [Silvanigrellaceae bacterium]|nr:hypothetical protein [Silvanigrellaceae bacterium]
QQLQKVTLQLEQTQKEFASVKNSLAKENEYLLHQNNEFKENIERFKISLMEFDNEKAFLLNAKQKIQELETDVKNLKRKKSQPLPDQNLIDKISSLEKKAEGLSHTNATLTLVNNKYRETITALQSKLHEPSTTPVSSLNRPGFFN